MPESHSVEYKKNWQDDYLKWVCGFANSKGGTLFLGIEDNGKVVGVDNSKKLLEELPNKIKNVLGVMAEVNLKQKNKKDVIEIKVQPYAVPISLRGRYYVRSGSSNQELTGHTLNDFLLRKTGSSWDEVVEKRATFADIDKKAVQIYLRLAEESGRIQERGLSLKELFEKLRLTEKGKLKRAAIVFFGKDPGKFYSGFSVRIGKFGENDIDLQFQESEEGNIIYLLDAIIGQLNNKFLIRKVSFKGLHRIETLPCPLPALREILLNALIHRSYSGVHTQIKVYDNRITFWNSGSLPDGMTLDMLKKPHSSIPRNKLLAEVAFRGGYIDAWGRGINKIAEACKNAGIEEPEFEEYLNGFFLTLKFSNKITPQVTPQVKKLLKHLKGKEKSKKDLMNDMKIRDEKYFKVSFLEPALKNNFIEMTIPDKPNSSLQKYKLKGEK